MGKKIVDTQELSEIRKLIGEDPETSKTADAFDLEEILAEVESTVDAPQVKTYTQGEQTVRFRVIASPSSAQSKAAAQDESAQEKSASDESAPSPVFSEQPILRTVNEADDQRLRAERPKFEVIFNANERHSRTEAYLEKEEQSFLSHWQQQRQQRREEKQREKELRRKQKQAEREALDAEDEYAPRDPRVMVRSCTKRARSLAVRSFFVLLLSIGAIYISIADGIGLPLPEQLSFFQQTWTALLVLLVMEFLSLLIGVDTFSLGLYLLLKGTPDRRSLVSCCAVASLLHGISMLVMPEWDAVLPHCGISILLLYAAMREEKCRLNARFYIFHTTMLCSSPIGVFSHDDLRDSIRRTVKMPVNDVESFLTELEKPDTVDQFSLVYAPIILSGSVIFSLIASVGLGVPSRFFWAFSNMLAICAPLGLLCAAGKPMRNIAKRMASEGTALTGVRGARRITKAKQATVSDADLFPTGCITLDAIKNYGKYDDEKLLAYAAALTDGQGLELGRIFYEALRVRYGRPVRAENVLQYESGGLVGDIGRDSVMVGTTAFLMKLHIRVPDIHGIENAVFVVINSQVAGAFTVTYHPAAQTYTALHAMRRLHTRPILATLDLNIAAPLVEALFELPYGSTAETELQRAALLNDPMYVSKDTICAVMTRDSITPYAVILQGAEKLASVVTTRLAISAFSGVCGVLLAFYLSFLYVTTALTPINILAYLLLWYIPGFFAGLGNIGRD